jgi:N-acetylneuraminic acid mutarotase
MVLDTATGEWQLVPAFPGGDVTGTTVVAAGIRMLVFGDARWGNPKGTGTLLNTTRIWTPQG